MEKYGLKGESPMEEHNPGQRFLPLSVGVRAVGPGQKIPAQPSRRSSSNGQWHEYSNFDALGWKKGDRLYIFINQKHRTAPPGALAALLSHEALHQDEFNSLAEETYAWTMEASVWYEIAKLYPESNDELHPLVVRENTLKKLFERGGYSNKYIKKTVMSNEGYKNLPATSPGFEDL